MLILISVSHKVMADSHQIHIATASNFQPTLKVINQLFMRENPSIQIILSAASSGKLYAQIIHGAPFDLFFSADADRPQQLIAQGIVTSPQVFTYAYGKLALWDKHSNEKTLKGYDRLFNNRFKFLSIANPKLAPYGQAAIETLTSLKLYEQVSSKMVQGENINQAFLFIDKGQADLGFIAYSQITQTTPKVPGQVWLVPQDLYTPIKQQVVLLNTSSPVKRYAKFLQSTKISALIQQHGYHLP